MKRLSRNSSLFEIIFCLVTLGLQSTEVFKCQWKFHLVYSISFVPAVLRALLSGCVLSILRVELRVSAGLRTGQLRPKGALCSGRTPMSSAWSMGHTPGIQSSGYLLGGVPESLHLNHVHTTWKRCKRAQGMWSSYSNPEPGRYNRFHKNNWLCLVDALFWEADKCRMIQKGFAEFPLMTVISLLDALMLRAVCFACCLLGRLAALL